MSEGFSRLSTHIQPVIARPFLTALLLCTTALHAERIPLTDLSRLEPRNTRAETITYRGRRALKLIEEPGEPGQLLVILRSHPFHDGTIDIDVAGALSATAAETDRGFIGIAFHMQSDNAHYECIYIRPTNGRAQDQLRRNHSTEYESLPDWPWYRLRKESPGVYESYADMAEGEWIHMKIVVHGAKAALYLGRSAQPCLLINDLKLGDTQGGIALWGGSGTVGYFANLKISKSERKALHPLSVNARLHRNANAAKICRVSASGQSAHPALQTNR